jgi:CRISPR-associated protein Cmr2
VSEDLVGDLEEVPPGRGDKITGKTDGSVFYEGRLLEALEEAGLDAGPQDNNPDPLKKGPVGRAKEALQSFLREVRPRLGEPIPYYAILLADGDRMGKVLSETNDFEKHRRISDDLEHFASSTRATVEKHEGALIYAGGDDVMALLPLHTVLACAAQMAGDFAVAMKAYTITEGEEGKDKRECSPTLSTGVAIVHHLLPLDEALALVRRTEKVAKGVPGKNALAVVVKKRGGEAVQVSGSWGEIDRRLEELVNLHRTGAISTKAQYELMDLDTRLGDTLRKADAARLLAEKRGDTSRPDESSRKQLESLRAVLQAEARRIVARKQGEDGAALTEETKKQLETLGVFADPGRLGRELYVAHLLAQAKVQSEGGALDASEAAGDQEVKA